jgi:anti-anti-sigma factor
MIGRMDPMRDHPQLAVACFEEGGAQVVELVGELDVGSIAELEDALAGTLGAGRICLDLARLEFIDSSGLAGIVRAHQAADGAGGELTIVAPSGTVRRTLETSGLTRMLRVVDDRATALHGGA